MLTARRRTILRRGSRDLNKGRTTLFNAYRIPTIVHADLIVFLDEGQVVKRCTHTELLELRGHYHGLWTLQRQGSS